MVALDNLIMFSITTLKLCMVYNPSPEKITNMIKIRSCFFNELTHFAEQKTCKDHVSNTPTSFKGFI